MLVAALALRFLLELALLVALAIWGFHVADGFALRTLTGLGAPAAAALLWGVYISPNRRIELGRVPRLLLELALFAAAGAALWQLGHPTIGVILFAAAGGDRCFLIWLRRRALADRHRSY